MSVYHHQVKIMIIYEDTSILVSGAFLKCFSIFSFAITAPDVPRGDPKNLPIVQIIFNIWFFEVNGDILRIQKLVLMSGTIDFIEP